MKARFKGFMVLAAGVLALVCAPQANATMQITLTNGASSVTVVDNGAGDLCPTLNCIVYFGTVGNYAINTSTGIAQNGVNPFLDLNSVHQVVATPNAGLLTVSASSTGYTVNTPQFRLQAGGTSSLTGATSFSAYGGNSNAIGDTSHLIGALNFPTSPFSGAVIGGGNTINPYSLTLVATINGITAGVASFDAAIDAVPEPVSVSMLGGVLLFTATAIRRKLRRTA